MHANDWMVTNQFAVVEAGHNRRPDVVVFVNGLPLAVLELKRAASATATIEDAYNQLQTYKQQIPSLFRTNAVLITSDGLYGRIGSLTAAEDHSMPWLSVTGAGWPSDALLRCEGLIYHICPTLRDSSGPHSQAYGHIAADIPACAKLGLLLWFEKLSFE